MPFPEKPKPPKRVADPQGDVWEIPIYDQAKWLGTLMSQAPQDVHQKLDYILHELQSLRELIESHILQEDYERLTKEYDSKHKKTEPTPSRLVPRSKPKKEEIEWIDLARKP